MNFTNGDHYIATSSLYGYTGRSWTLHILLECCVASPFTLGPCHHSAL